MQEVSPGTSFAAIGLLDMFNAGGAVEEIGIKKGGAPSGTVALTVRGCGRFGAYCSQRPLRCALDSAEAEFGYDAATGLLTVAIPVPEKPMHRWTLEVQV